MPTHQEIEKIVNKIAEKGTVSLTFQDIMELKDLAQLYLDKKLVEPASKENICHAINMFVKNLPIGKYFGLNEQSDLAKALSGKIGKQELASRTEIIEILRKLGVDRLNREYKEKDWVDFAYEASGLLVGKVSKKEPELMREVVICAAVKDTLGDIWRGHRHGDCFNAILNAKRKINGKPEAQGFITSKNRYVCREEGRKLQDEAEIKSVDPEGYRGNTLFSEDLY